MSSQRPTLPSLRTLNLLPPAYTKCHTQDSPYDSYESPSFPRLNVPQHSWPHIKSSRRVSTSASSSTTSRTPSPTPSDAGSLLSAQSSSFSASKNSNLKLTFIPSSFADADAIVVVPADPAAKSLLLTGPAVERLRHGHPQRQIAPGARLHPYRFCRASSRRPSSVSSE